MAHVVYGDDLLFVDVVLDGDIRERNRKAMQIYGWLGERLDRGTWNVIRLDLGARVNRYFLEDANAALLFKLTWGGET